MLIRKEDEVSGLIPRRGSMKKLIIMLMMCLVLAGCHGLPKPPLPPPPPGLPVP